MRLSHTHQLTKKQRHRKSQRKTWTNQREFELRLERSEKAFKMLMNTQFVQTLSFREQQKLKQQALLFVLYKKQDKQPWKQKKQPLIKFGAEEINSTTEPQQEKTLEEHEQELREQGLNPGLLPLDERE